MKTKKNNYGWRKGVAALLLVCFVFSGTLAPSLKPVQADIWGTNIASTFIKQAMEEAMMAIKDAILSAIKQMVIKKISEKINEAIGNMSGGSPIIADYQKFIFETARGEAIFWLDSFFVKVNNTASEGIRKEMRKLEITLQKELDPHVPQFTLDQQVDSDNPYVDVFNQAVGGGKEAYETLVFEGDHYLDIYLDAKKKMAVQAEQAAEGKSAEAQTGGGFQTVTKKKGDKVVVMPGSLMQSTTAEAVVMPFQDIVNAQAIGRLVGAVIATAVIKKVFGEGYVVNDPASDYQQAFQGASLQATQNVIRVGKDKVRNSFNGDEGSDQGSGER